MKSRHHARQAAFQMLYRYDISMRDRENKRNEFNVSDDELNSHFDHFEISPQIREFATKLIRGTLENIDILDEKLEKHAANWKISRMPVVDRNLLRMALYEIMNFPEIPNSVTIDEAIKLGKQFGTAETSPFINGILDTIAKDLATKT